MSSSDLEGVRSDLYSRYASTHAGVAVADVAARMALRDFSPFLAALAGGTVLDMGCGQGQLVAALASCGFDAHGVDRSPEQVQLAHEAGVGQVQLGEISTFLAGRPAAFDAVIATDLLEHLTKAEVLSTFRAVRAALKPGGLLLVRTPNGSSPFFGHYQYGDITHETVFTVRSLEQLARQCDFIGMEALPVRPMSPSLLRRMLAGLAERVLLMLLQAEVGRQEKVIVTQNLVFAARVTQGNQAVHP